MNIKYILLLIVITFLSCNNRNNVKNILPRSSFLKIEKEVRVKMCHPQKKDYCIKKSLGATASGVIVKTTDHGAYALTAGHVCLDKEAKKFLKKYEHKMIFRVLDINKKEFPVKIIAIDKVNDLCMLQVYGIKKPAALIASTKPEPGDRIYNLAAPTGIFDKNMVPTFEGFYNGDSGNRSIYSMPAKGGSSGSPILNHKGEIIGMVSAAFVYFPNLAISPKFEETARFIKSTIYFDRIKKESTNIFELLKNMLNF